MPWTPPSTSSNKYYNKQRGKILSNPHQFTKTLDARRLCMQFQGWTVTLHHQFQRWTIKNSSEFTPTTNRLQGQWQNKLSNSNNHHLLLQLPAQHLPCHHYNQQSRNDEEGRDNNIINFNQCTITEYMIQDKGNSSSSTASEQNTRTHTPASISI